MCSTSSRVLHHGQGFAGLTFIVWIPFRFLECTFTPSSFLSSDSVVLLTSHNSLALPKSNQSERLKTPERVCGVALSGTGGACWANWTKTATCHTSVEKYTISLLSHSFQLLSTPSHCSPILSSSLCLTVSLGASCSLLSLIFYIFLSWLLVSSFVLLKLTAQRRVSSTGWQSKPLTALT